MESFLSSSLKRWVSSGNCRMNLLRYTVMPKKRCKSCSELGKRMSLIALTFSGSGEIPFSDICVPRILVRLLQKHTCSYLVSNLTFEFCLRLVQCECLIELRSILI